MSYKKHEIRPIGGMDFDSDDRDVKQTDYRKAINIRNSVAYIERQNSSTNVKGNVLVEFALPEGENKCIGALNDKQQRTCIYMIWNSEFNHSIYRYFPERTDTANPNGVVERIITFNFGWIKDRYITGIDLINNDLLYWTDNIKPRKININKANITNKAKSWDIYLPKFDYSEDTDKDFRLKLKDSQGNILLDLIRQVTDDNRKDVIQDLSSAINNGFSNFLKADECNCFLKVTETNLSLNAVEVEVEFTDSQGNDLFPKVTPSNWYGTNLVDRFFDRAKYPPGCDPLVIYKKDEKINYNYIKEKVFQFRLQYVYDDAERSALGPISEIPINNTVCGANKDLNYVEIDFNDENLLDSNIWTILKRVRVHVRERNSGFWKVVEDLDICEFYHIVDANKKVMYKYFNDVAQAGIDDVLAAKLYDKVPRYSESQKIIENRLIDGGVLDDYDTPCVDADLGIQVEDSANKETYNVTGKIRIFNWQNNGNWESETIRQPYGSDFLPLTNTSQPIMQLNKDDENGIGQFPVWGGIGVISNSETRTFQGSGYEQWIPEGGFPVYLAGTDYVDISKQINTDFAQTTNNIIDAQDNVDGITDWIKDGNDVYSTFNIKNVRPGRYIVRIASHWCSIGDKLDKGPMYDITKGRAYQGTSTNVCAVEDANGRRYFVSEFEIEITNSDIDVGTFYVDDLVNIKPEDDIKGSSVSGYLIDNKGNTSLDDADEGNRVEKAALIINENDVTDNLLIDAKYPYYTDHNGYWYRRKLYAFELSDVIVQTPKISHIQNNNPPSFSEDSYSVQTYYDSQSNGVLKDFNLLSTNPNPLSLNEHQQLLSIVSDQQFSNNLKTFIEGYVKDSDGNGVSNVMVQFAETGRVALTDSQGFYRIPVFANISFAYIKWSNTIGKTLVLNNIPLTSSEENNTVQFITQTYGNYTLRNDNILLSDYNSCPITYSSSLVPSLSGSQFLAQIEFDENVTTVGPPYSPTAVFTLFDIGVTVRTEEVGKARKRGGSYLVGIRYQDEAGRVCSVVDLGKAYIPFYGEDLNQYYPDSYPIPNTKKYGPARIRVNLNSKPPKWAHYYQILITKNIHHSKSLQYLVNNVQYITSYDDDNQEASETSYSNGDANQVMINLNNLIDQFDRENDSQLGYTFEEGDRVRLVLNEDGVYYDELFEFKAVSYKNGNWLVLKTESSLPEIKTGVLVEIFNRRLLEEEKIYYESATCYKCTSPGTSQNSHSVPQLFIKGGDSYFRKRTMRVIDEDDSVFSSFNYVIESLRISDNYPSEDLDLGRVGIVDKDFKEIFRPTSLRVSNIFVPDTEVNGLSNNEGLEDIEIDREFGLIKRLLRVGSILLSVHLNRSVSVYVNESIFIDSNGEETVGVSDKFLNNVRPLTGNYGTQHPESIVEYENLAFGFDSFRNAVWQYSQAGLEIISENKARNYFRQVCENGIWDAPAVYDPFYREYILTIGKRGQEFEFEVVASDDNLDVTGLESSAPSGIPNFTSVEIEYKGTLTKFQIYFTSNNKIFILGNITDQYKIGDKVKLYIRGDRETIAYSNLKKIWTTFYTYEQDYYTSVLNSLISFNNGQLMVHDKGNINEFNGIFAPSELWLLANPDPNHPKVFYANELQQKQLDGNCDWEIYEITNREGQLSRILKGSWRNKQDHWYSEFKRDLNTTVSNPILNGERLRSVAILLKLRNDNKESVDLWSYIINFEVSERTKI